MERRLDMEEGRVKKIIPKWMCTKCGVSHEPGSCTHYRKAQAQFWVVRKKYLKEENRGLDLSVVSH